MANSDPYRHYHHRSTRKFSSEPNSRTLQGEQEPNLQGRDDSARNLQHFISTDFALILCQIPLTSSNSCG